MCDYDRKAFPAIPRPWLDRVAGAGAPDHVRLMAHNPGTTRNMPGA